MSHTAYILTGSNLGDPKIQLEEACHRIEEYSGKITRKSSLYKTAAWGNTGQNDFLNQVLEINTQLEPEALLANLLTIEQIMGRTRQMRWEPRIIDIDILFYDNRIIQTDSLILPHPFIQDRRFTLVPLCEIASDLIHPVSGKTMKVLLNECPDQLTVEKF